MTPLSKVITEPLLRRLRGNYFAIEHRAFSNLGWRLNKLAEAGRGSSRSVEERGTRVQDIVTWLGGDGGIVNPLVVIGSQRWILSLRH